MLRNLEELVWLKSALAYAKVVDVAREAGADDKRSVKHRRRRIPGASRRHSPLVIDIEPHCIRARLRAVDDKRNMVPCRCVAKLDACPDCKRREIGDAAVRSGKVVVRNERACKRTSRCGRRS